MSEELRAQARALTSPDELILAAIEAPRVGFKGVLGILAEYARDYTKALETDRRAGADVDGREIRGYRAIGETLDRLAEKFVG